LPFERLLSVVAELSHLGSLIIDDIEDQSPLRRGEASIHLRYGTDLAINAGNTLYFLPLLLLENHAHLSIGQRERMYQVIVRQYIRSHFGQGMDIYWSKFVSTDNLQHWIDGSLSAQVLDMYAEKTAALVVCLARMACIIAEADEQAQNACVDFSRAFGVAFQIMDDVLNFSNSGKWTKVVGEDLAAGKLTYVLVKALGKVNKNERETLQRLVCDQKYRSNSENIETGLRIVRDSGVLVECRREARSMVQEKWRELSQHLISSESKQMLRLLCSKLTDLTFAS
jgi:geranylgeranyl diphosphate synthase type 3/geranylgeranyl diphosphate synthase type I